MYCLIMDLVSQSGFYLHGSSQFKVTKMSQPTKLLYAKIFFGNAQKDPKAVCCFTHWGNIAGHSQAQESAPIVRIMGI